MRAQSRFCWRPTNGVPAVLETYEEVKSIHIYSLGPHPTKDMALLSDAARQVFTISTPGESLRIFGTITNTNVRRRERKGPGLKAAAAATAATKVGVKPAAKPATVPSMVKQESFDAKTPTPPPSASTSSGAAKKPKPAPKGGAFSIMQSFAKGAATAKTKKAETSQPATPSGDDSSIHPMSEGEEDDSAFLPKPKAAVVSGRKTKAQQREEQLKAMMEEEDEEEPEEREDTPMEEPVEEEPAPEPEKAEPEPAEVVSASGDGRRRGRRKIMKKRRFLDEEGQLGEFNILSSSNYTCTNNARTVTVTEPAWEEFSEDEAPPPVIAKTSSSAPAAPAAKGKKAAGAKGGQGSIMSFFNKK